MAAKGPPICYEIVGRTQFPGSSKFPGITLGVWWWLSAILVACRCLDFRTHNPKVVGSNPTPATIYGNINPFRSIETGAHERPFSFCPASVLSGLPIRFTKE
jgi:hypothetical protein